MADPASVHELVALRLAALDQRYTRLRRTMVETLVRARRPLSVPDILDRAEIPQSTAYRIITDLGDAGIVRRVAGADDHGRFELAEDLAGHHHHLVCAGCGRVDDVDLMPPLERAIDEAARALARAWDFEVLEHRLDLVGRCPECRAVR